MRRVFAVISVVVLGFGLYLRFLYDVPDAQETTNFFTSWFLIIISTAGLLANLLWSSPKNGR